MNYEIRAVAHKQTFLSDRPDYNLMHAAMFKIGAIQWSLGPFGSVHELPGMYRILLSSQSLDEVTALIRGALSTLPYNTTFEVFPFTNVRREDVTARQTATNALYSAIYNAPSSPLANLYALSAMRKNKSSQ